MPDKELFITWVGLSIICVRPVDDVRVSISWPAELLLSFFYHNRWTCRKSSFISLRIKIYLEISKIITILDQAMINST